MTIRRVLRKDAARTLRWGFRLRPVDILSVDFGPQACESQSADVDVMLWQGIEHALLMWYE